MAEMRLFGVDFTSAPRAGKAITVASGHLDAHGMVRVEALQGCADWPAFEALLAQAGPWCGGFDFPFGLPRELVLELGWPGDWAGLVRHVKALGKPAFRAALDAVRESRPMGSRYIHRACDLPAKSHSPMKLVNPPVGLMFFEGAPRLLEAGVTLPGMHAGDPQRIALEAYPGLLAREIVQGSYKSDDRARQTPARHEARQILLGRLRSGEHSLKLPLRIDAAACTEVLDDASGDRLDALLALVQTAWCWQRRERGYGLSPGFDPIEGWIAACRG
ncbi:DUF429 domain-containing protein [Uliginosibacterium paludis]|uniref:DUF429 domain-containing protein n=1 Tax=Uliginosibacterium paludis TaxID=1615952 RepID=A0ABV2CNG9_9RHOO